MAQANKLLIKRTATPGNIPTTGALDIGELAVNLADAILYTEKSGPTIISLSGVVTITGTTDQVIATPSTGSNLESIYTLSTPQSIATTSAPSFAGMTLTGALTLNATNELRLADTDSSNYAAFKSPGVLTNNNTYTLPAATGSVGQVLKIASGPTATAATLEWGSAGEVGGSNTQVQFNTGGAFDADPGLTFVAGASDTLSVGVAAVSAGIVDLLNTGTYKIDGTDVLSATGLGTAVVGSSLTSVGTIATGVWQGTTVGQTFGGTGFSTYATGDLLYASATDTLSKLVAGTNTHILTLTGGVPVWAAPVAAAPAGSTTQVQFNLTSAFAGDPGLTFVASTSDTLSVGVAAGSAGVVNLLNTGTYKIDGTDVLTATGLGGAVVGSSLTSVGTIATGVWNGTAIIGTYGGTGVNNSTRTITIAGNFATAGAFATTLTATAATNVTLPTTGTLVNTAVATLSSLTSVGTIATGVWNGTVITGQYGGTGVNNSTRTITLGGNLVTSGAFATTLTVTALTNVTLPTSGTLITNSVATLSSLTSVGTIGTGVWQGTLVDELYGGTGFNTYALGDIIYASAANTLSKLVAGTNTHILTLAGGVPTWAAPVAAGAAGSNTEIQFNSSNAFAGDAALTWSGTKLKTEFEDAATNTVGIALQISRSTTAPTPAAGIGAGIEFSTETTAANFEIGGVVESVATTTTALSEAFDLLFKTMSGGATAVERGRFKSTGQLNLPTGGIFQINNANVLTATALGAAVVGSSLTSVGTIATGVWNGTAIIGTYGGTGVNNSTRTITIAGNLSTAAAFTTAGAFATTLTSTAATNVTLPTTGTLVNTAVATLSSLTSVGTIATGVWNGTAIIGTYGGTGVNNSTRTITIAGNFATAGAFATTLTATAATNVTLPTTGTLVNTAVTTLSSLVSVGTIATGVWQGTLVDELYGGTGFNTYATGDLIYASAANTLSKLVAGTNTHVLTLTGGVPGWAAPAGGTAAGASTQIQFNTANAFAADPGLTFAAGAPDTLSVGVAATSAGAVDLLNTGTYKINGTDVLTSTGLGGAVVGSSLTSVGTIATGVWNGTAIIGTYGGTGVNNSTRTITIAGNFATAGAFATTLTATAATNVTLPTTGTLVNTAVATLSSLTSVGTIATGVWNGTAIIGTYGGTGVNNSTRTITIAGNLSTAAAFTTAGANALTLTTTGITNVTLPTSGTLITSSVATLSSLTSVGTIGTGTWQGATIIGTYGGTGVNNSTRTITIAGNFATVGASALTLTTTGITNSTLPVGTKTLVATDVATLSSLTSVGTIATGVWNGTAIIGTYGGTGVNNSTRTITIAGNFATAGAFATTLTATAATNVTLPTTGTLVNTAVATLSSLTSVGTIATGVWQGTLVDELYGGTGFNTYATGDLIYASATNTVSKRTIGSTNDVLTVVAGVPTWAAPAGGATSYTVQATSFTATANTDYFITGNSVVVTLPVTPSNNDYVFVANGSAITSCSVARNGKTIMAAASDLTIDTTNFALKFVYYSTTGDWRIL